MTVLTINHYNDVIDSFVKNITDSSKSYYMYIGKPDPWTDESNPPTANGSVADYQQSIYKDIVYGKKIGINDVAYMIPRYTWTSNTVYDRYDQNDGNLYDKIFYVVNDRNEVYKCINNNYGNPSTVQPYFPISYGCFETSDGYTWKFMYRIDGDYYDKFSTKNYIPVAANSSGSAYDINVRGNTVNGTIDSIIVNNNGLNYQTYNTGFLANYVNNFVVQLSNTASQYSNFYTDSTLYLKTGFGAGQLRKIVSYNGLTKQAVVDTPFNVQQYMEISNTIGIENITKGQTVTQDYQTIAYNYNSGYFNVGDTVIQTDAQVGSNSYGIGTIVSANATIIKVDYNNANTIVPNVPIYSAAYSGIQRTTGTVSITTGSNTVTGVGTVFKDVANTANSQYQIGQYIRIGNNANTNIRRITSIASNTSLQVDYPFNSTLVANIHYLMPVAANPSSITINHANAVIVDTNLNAVTLNISNSIIVGKNFTVGEIVTMVDNANVSQLSNGTVSYSNSTTVVLSNALGPAFQSGYYILGSSSLQKSYIDYVKTSSNITVANPIGKFINQQPLYFRPTANLSQQVANASLVISYISPNELSEYIVSPTVVIDGDGENAAAYSIVNTVSKTIESVVVVNTGVGYTYANVSVLANNQYGSNASFSPVISPVRGHGYDPVEELGSKYVSVTTVFQNILRENLNFPGYGNYRKVGIIQDPLFEDVTITLNSFDRATLTVNNSSGYNFSNGEIVLQTATNAAAIVSVYDSGQNSAFLELKNVRGDWASNGAYANTLAVDDTIYGLSSGASANVLTFDTNYFIISSNVEIISEVSSGAHGRIKQVLSNTEINLTDVTGKFDINDTAYDPITNAYANVVSIYVSNNSVDVSTVFGDRFNQTVRISLDTNYGVFHDFETVKQDVTGATGKLISSNNELDLSFSSPSGLFVIGDVVYSTNTNANGIITFANTSYMKLTSVNGIFYPNDTINNGSVTATADTIYKVLVLNDVFGNRFQSGSYIIMGANSGAYGYNVTANTIDYPDLVRNSGNVIFVENLTPFSSSNTNNQKFSLIIKF